MVDLFLQKKILFTDIVINNEKLLNIYTRWKPNFNWAVTNIDDIKQSFAIVDEYA